MTAAPERNFEDVYALSPLQTEPLDRARIEPAAALTQSLYEFDALDVPSFEEAWRQVVARHSILRTTFHWEGLRRPVQITHREAALPVEHYDWRSLTSETHRKRLDRALEADRKRGLDLAAAPLMRLSLLRTAESRYLLVWTRHPLILDDDAAALVIADWKAHYMSLLGMPAVELLPPGSYRDYAAWTLAQLPAAEQYWRSALARFAGPTPLPVEASVDPPGEGMRIQQVSLGKPLALSLRKLAERCDVPRRTIVLGAWALLLGRYVGREDVVIAERGRSLPKDPAEKRMLVGPCTSAVPVKVSLPGSIDLGDWLRDLEAALEAPRRHGFVPESILRSAAQFPASRPLIESVVAWGGGFSDASARRAVGASGMRVEAMQAPGTPAAYPLAITATPKGTNLTLKAAYDPARVSDDSASRYLEDLRSVLAKFADGADLRLSDIAPLKRGFAPSVVPLQPNGSKFPFFCVHPAGGHVWSYATLAQSLPHDRPFYAFEAEELTTKARPAQRVEELATRYLRSLRSIQPQGPYVLGGWSLGGLVAYEMANQLMQKGQSVSLLALFECTPPSKRADKPQTASEVLLRFGRQLGLRLPVERLVKVEPGRLLRMLWKRAQESLLLPKETTLKQFHDQVRLYQSHGVAVWSYEPPRYPGKVTLFRTERHAAKDASAGRRPWAGLAAEVETVVVPGGHASMFREPHVRTLAQKLQAALSGRR